MKTITCFVFYLILAVQLTGQNQIKITSATIHFRNEPWIGENSICLIPKGTIVSVDYSNQELTEWTKISYINKIGYVYSKYLINLQTNSVFSNSGQTSYHSSSAVKHYTNSRGERVQSPTYYSTQPKGATAQCRDGTYSFSRSRRGTCSHHGGVRRWL